ncbi:MAG: GIY-YIG nuclease family protein [Chloroflexi bacterium]|nr:GIY-YIG nuclease family protein [Chloroflexota bacterium]
MPPRTPGTYALLIRLERELTLTVGRLGTFVLAPGWYVYLGSALGGLAARLARHESREKRLRWHIDYLLAQAELVEAWWAAGSERQECRWAQAVLRLPGATVPIRRFGASDCRCPAHLVAFTDRPHRQDLAALLWAGSAGRLVGQVANLSLDRTG